MDDKTRESLGLWFRTAGIVLVLTAIVAFLTSFYSKKFSLQTGPAKWIWIEHEIEEATPIAFFAVRDVAVPHAPPFVRIRIACDADWSLHLNGREIAGGSGGASPGMKSFDLSDIARDGEPNRFVVSLRSDDGVGGFLASIDYAPLRENDVVTDESWKICREWAPGILTGEVACDESPVVLGQPPVGRWNYPQASEGVAYDPDADVLEPPGEGIAGRIVRREIRIIHGVAVASERPIPAVIFDLTQIEGRGRVLLDRPAQTVHLVEVRYADERSELDQAKEREGFVFAPGEDRVTDSIARSFRYMAVADPSARIAVVEEKIPTRKTAR